MKRVQAYHRGNAHLSRYIRRDSGSHNCDYKKKKSLDANACCIELFSQLFIPARAFITYHQNTASHTAYPRAAC